MIYFCYRLIIIIHHSNHLPNARQIGGTKFIYTYLIITIMTILPVSDKNEVNILEINKSLSKKYIFHRNATKINEICTKTAF